MKNKIILITGGASGIGLGIIKELMNDNTVISMDRNASKIAALKASYPKVMSIRADISNPADLDTAIADVEKQYGRIDLLINNAGLGFPMDFAKDSEAELMKNVETEINVNYLAPIRLTKKALPLLKKSAEPIVVIISSGLAYIPIAMLGSYCASKSAIHFVAMSIRHQLASSKVRVVEVLPPVVDTAVAKDNPMKKMPVETFAKIFLKGLAKGDNVMNIGQTAGLAKFSRFLPKTAFKMLNKS